MRLPVIHKVDTRSLIPAGEEAQLLEARRRAGTLMGGETAGGQRDVRIWAPSKKWTRLRLTGVTLDLLPCLLFVSILWAGWCLRPTEAGVFVMASLALSLFLSTHIRHPYRRSFIICGFNRPTCYVSTDGNGIAFVQRSYNRSLAWRDVVALKRVGPNSLELRIDSRRAEEISLDGYTPEDIESLISLICSRAHLEPQPIFGMHPQCIERPATLAVLGAARSLRTSSEGVAPESRQKSGPVDAGLR